MANLEIPAHVYATWTNDREAALTGALGFRVKDGQIQNISGSRAEIISVRPVNPTEEKMWAALMNVAAV